MYLFTNLPDDKSENAEPSNDIKPNSDDNVSLTVTLELESKETRSCEDTSKLSETNRIRFEDEKEAADFYKVCNIGKCIGNRTVSILLLVITTIAVAAFVSLLVIYVGQNDRKDIHGKYCFFNEKLKLESPKLQDLCRVFSFMALASKRCGASEKIMFKMYIQQYSDRQRIK